MMKIKDLTKYDCGLDYPEHLIPEYKGDAFKCQCGNRFNSEDPITSSWIQTEGAWIHKPLASQSCTVYYRPTIGDCSCHQEYDGQHQLLLNLDNRNLFTYKWMFEILLNIQGTEYPLRSSFNYANRLRDFCSTQGRMKEYMYNKLRHAYNSFTRLLDVNPSSNFICSQCQVEGCDIVIFDGICMGCCKDRMASNEIPSPLPGKNIPEVNRQRQNLSR